MFERLKKKKNEKQISASKYENLEATKKRRELGVTKQKLRMIKILTRKDNLMKQVYSKRRTILWSRCILRLRKVLLRNMWHFIVMNVKKLFFLFYLEYNCIFLKMSFLESPAKISQEPLAQTAWFFQSLLLSIRCVF